jgi:AraC-like DNA-binding protein
MLNSNLANFCVVMAIFEREIALRTNLMQDIDPILYLGISQAFFAGLLIAVKKPASVADKIMAAWLFLISIEFIFALLNKNLIDIYSFPFVAFTYGPLLFLYVKFMTDPDREFNRLSLLHFIPFACFFIISVVFRAQPMMRDLDSFFEPDRFISLRIIYGSCFFLSITTYSILSFNEIRKHQQKMKDLVSYTSGIITLNWLKVISISFYTIYFMLFILGGLNMIGDYIPFDPYYITFGFLVLFSFVFGFYGIRQSMIQEVRNTENRKETEKYSRSGLKQDQAEEYLQQLLTYVADSKPYLNPDLTINDLAGQTGIPRHYITQILNDNYSRNFFTFINEYRVNEVIARFDDPRFNHYTILAIAFDSGFNSKTTFNSFFKMRTGLTPSEFRNKRNSPDRQGRTTRGEISGTD